MGVLHTYVYWVGYFLNASENSQDGRPHWNDGLQRERGGGGGGGGGGKRWCTIIIHCYMQSFSVLSPGRHWLCQALPNTHPGCRTAVCERRHSEVISIAYCTIYMYILHS